MFRTNVIFSIYFEAKHNIVRKKVYLGVCEYVIHLIQAMYHRTTTTSNNINQVLPAMIGT